jgi:hypothetical protein
VVPVPDVDSRVKVLEAVEPPITKGITAEVVIVGVIIVGEVLTTNLVPVPV